MNVANDLLSTLYIAIINIWRGDYTSIILAIDDVNYSLAIEGGICYIVRVSTDQFNITSNANDCSIN